jgi:glycogen synthase
MTADAVGGVWTYAVELCRELDRRGIDVMLAVMGPSPSLEQRAEISPLRRIRIVSRPFRLEWMDDPWDDVAEAGEWLLEVARNVQPDVVHLNGYCHASLPWQAPCVVVGHSCVLSWWRAVRHEQPPPRWSRYQSEVGRGVRAAAATIAPSQTMLAWLAEFYGPLPRPRTILNGRTTTVPGIPKESLILTAGRVWDEAKNIASLCDIAGDLPWPTLVAGATDETECGTFGENVRYLGQLPSGDLQLWMARAPIYVMPARYEPFGLSVLEAALAGCALVLGDIPTLREIWGEAAVYVDPEDRAALRATLMSLVGDAPRRNALAAAAGRRASELTPQRMADQYLALYSELIGERRPLLSLSAV